jgi:hypothetical protein
MRMSNISLALYRNTKCDWYRVCPEVMQSIYSWAVLRIMRCSYVINVSTKADKITKMKLHIFKIYIAFAGVANEQYIAAAHPAVNDELTAPSTCPPAAGLLRVISASAIPRSPSTSTSLRITSALLSQE